MSRFRKPCPVCGCRAIDRDETLCHTQDCALRNSCPATSSCSAQVGSWCNSPSGHKAMTLHKARRELVAAAIVARAVTHGTEDKPEGLF